MFGQVPPGDPWPGSHAPAGPPREEQGLQGPSAPGGPRSLLANNTKCEWSLVIKAGSPTCPTSPRSLGLGHTSAQLWSHQALLPTFPLPPGLPVQSRRHSRPQPGSGDEVRPGAGGGQVPPSLLGTPGPSEPVTPGSSGPPRGQRSPRPPVTGWEAGVGGAPRSGLQTSIHSLPRNRHRLLRASYLRPPSGVGTSSTRASLGVPAFLGFCLAFLSMWTFGPTAEMIMWPGA